MRPRRRHCHPASRVKQHKTALGTWEYAIVVTMQKCQTWRHVSRNSRKLSTCRTISHLKHGNICHGTRHAVVICMIVFLCGRLADRSRTHHSLTQTTGQGGRRELSAHAGTAPERRLSKGQGHYPQGEKGNKCVNKIRTNMTNTADK